MFQHELESLTALIKKFEKNKKLYKSSKYNETQVRSEFINPFLKILGWDVENCEGKTHYLRDVLEEDTVEVENSEGKIEKKKPDYALRLNGERKFFIEVKKPSVDIETNSNAAFQIRRYGWNAKLPISLLTNFEKIAVYNCIEKPNADDTHYNSRIKILNIKELLDQETFEEFYNTYSKEAVYSGEFENHILQFENQGTENVDDFFLEQIQNWRLEIAKDILGNNAKLSVDEVDTVTQNVINKVIFLRICEDRNIEEYENLLDITKFKDLKVHLDKADKKFNSGLFESLDSYGVDQIIINDGTMLKMFKELYFPNSPYAFELIESHILGEIYEQFLSKKLQIDNGQLILKESPEIIESNGVVTTPKYIVKRIIESTIDKKVADLSLEELQNIKICDPASGSGIFLLEAYEYLMSTLLKRYSETTPELYTEYIKKNHLDEWELTFTEKRRILIENIFGVDIDYQAVEVAKFSLLLKLLEGENANSLDEYNYHSKNQILPSLHENIFWGNSLVDSNYIDIYSTASETILDKLIIFDWEENFENIFSEKGGFDFIIGNPPYIKIQNMIKYGKEEIDYYKNPDSKYVCGLNNNFDKYSLFVERSIQLLNNTGRLGFIIPNKFLTLQSGEALRTIIYNDKLLSELSNFGSQKVFQGKGTYTCLLTLYKGQSDKFIINNIYDLEMWRHNSLKGKESSEHLISKYPPDKTWVFLNNTIESILDGIKVNNPSTIETIAKPFVGLQTSKDNVFILKKNISYDDNFIYFTDQEKKVWKIERSITRPILYKQGISLFREPEIQAFAIFPYKAFEKDTAIIYSLEELQNNFPGCFAYLNNFKNQLLKRKVKELNETNFYKYGRSQSLTKFQNEDKIIWSVVTNEPKYFIDKKDFLFTGGGNGPYYALRKNDLDNKHSLEYIYAILIHPITESFLKSGHTSFFGGGHYSHGKQFIEKLPFREINFDDISEINHHNEITLWVQEVISLTKKVDKGLMPKDKVRAEKKIQQLKKKIENKIFTLYNLNEHEQKIILNL